MADVNEILRLMQSPSDEEIALVKKAYAMSEEAHKGQQRLSGEPFFTHPFEVAKIIASLGRRGPSVAGGLLHDVLEDTSITSENLKKEFGEEVFFLVEGVTKLGKLKYSGVKRWSESLRKLFVAVSKDLRVLIIKLADRLHNMRTLKYLPEYKQKLIALETLEIYAPIAYRLGIRKMSRELEDLAFPYVYPEEYKKVSELAKKKFHEDLKHLDRFRKSIIKALAGENITDIHTDFRIKGLYSLWKKLQRKDMDIEKVFDIAALRVIVPTVTDCYKALGTIHGIWRPLPGRIKDYIAFPKPNGYKSLHTTIFTGDGRIAEIQIKTKEMYQESEYGVSSHISYKQNSQKDKSKDFKEISKIKSASQHLKWIWNLLPKKISLPLGSKKQSNLNDIPSWVQELVEYQESTNENWSDNLKSDFLEQRIFVFTPKGDVVDLPVDSSPIDYAYAIHSDIGNHISGAKVNRKFVSLDTKLKNGDIVEIETKSNATPHRKWVDFAKTTAAKKNIRAYLLSQEIDRTTKDKNIKKTH